MWWSTLTHLPSLPMKSIPILSLCCCEQPHYAEDGRCELTCIVNGKQYSVHFTIICASCYSFQFFWYSEFTVYHTNGTVVVCMRPVWSVVSGCGWLELASGESVITVLVEADTTSTRGGSRGRAGGAHAPPFGTELALNAGVYRTLSAHSYSDTAHIPLLHVLQT